MNIIGWIREGDMAACGGKVAEGLDTCTSRGVPYTFQGARMACRNNCLIAEGFSRATLANGRSRVIHGMKSSGGCPIYSTLNEIDGVGNESGEAIPLGFIQCHDGQWAGNTAGVSSSFRQEYDEQFLLLDGDSRPLARTYYTAKLAAGEFLHGETDEEGKTQRFYTPCVHHIEIYLGHLDN
ncbi:MAG: PAAR domain-containing protein [Pseudomonadota bacterium]